MSIQGPRLCLPLSAFSGNAVPTTSVVMVTLQDPNGAPLACPSAGALACPNVPQSPLVTALLPDNCVQTDFSVTWQGTGATATATPTPTRPPTATTTPTNVPTP